MSHKGPKLHMRLLSGVAFATFAALSSVSNAQAAAMINIPPQPLADALDAFAVQSPNAVLFSPDIAVAKRSQGVSNVSDPEAALRAILAGTGLTYRLQGDTYLIVRADAPRPIVRATSVAPAETVSGSAVEGLVVTAQKRRENIQDVPIAISAFTQDQLTTSQIAGGPDLMTQVPNLTFTKTNFSSYSIQIRGIGTQAISATVDPAVAVAFNNTPVIRNRFFEQEFFDLERVEVLRGPQGTLFGRNATAGVINLISSKPSFEREAKGSIDLANYQSRRLEGMINIPLVEDKVALRLAGAWTKREGYSFNELDGQPIDGRDLWSTRLSLRLAPTDSVNINIVWEHFSEDDDRLRSGKQLCKRNPNNPLFPDSGGGGAFATNTYTSQGCEAASLYSPEAFQVPNGYSLPYYGPLSGLATPVFDGLDPYVDSVQSTDLRVIQSQIQPQYSAESDFAQLLIEVDVSDNLTLASETAYNADRVFSLQDFNRFNTRPGIFNPDNLGGEDVANGVLSPDGVFCDPQIGCSDRLLGMDIATADSRQFSQEFRLTSDYDGPFNFSVGANFLRYDTIDKYYVFFNTLTLWGLSRPTPEDPYIPGVTDNLGEQGCADPITSDPNAHYDFGRCFYIDPNPVGSLNDLGRNYFLSKNPYRLLSYAVFGEAQYQITPSLKLTGGLRWTVDRKRAPQVPSWLITPGSFGLPVAKVIEQEWTKPSGRLVIDWKPDLAFTDETLFYASYAHGYKAGGANPPPPVDAFVGDVGDELDAMPETFEPEYVDAIELGTKSTLLNGGLTLNGNVFYYDYQGSQISQIVNRTALNLNFDATVWGAELEMDWRPLENLRFGFKGGYEHTEMADGSRAIDTMDRTAGNPDWVVIKSFPTNPSNCVLPTWLALTGFNHLGGNFFAAGQMFGGACMMAYNMGLDPITGLPYVPNPTEVGGPQSIPAGYPGFDPATAPNNGQGFFKDLSGNELPNAPHYTATITADWTLPLQDDWLMTLHTDLYYQSEAWTRVFNTDGYDKLKAYNNINFAAIFMNEESGWNVMAYVKNVLDRDSITGAFLNSDDTGLTTNVFLTEPRLYGVRVTKQWTGMRFWGTEDTARAHTPGEPYKFTLELGGGPSRFDAENEVLAPDWLSRFRPSAGFPLWPQSEDVDWGDTRDVKFTYAPDGRGGLKFAAALHYGQTNGVSRGEASEHAPDFCILGPEVEDFCGVEGPLNWGSSVVRDREEFTAADFRVGKEVGIGAWGEDGSSVVGVGLRYAEFTSQTDLELHTKADQYLPPVDAAKYIRHWHDYDEDLAATREFSGVGPQLSWEASSRLFGVDAAHADMEWSAEGGVLFGRQKASVTREAIETYTTGTPLAPPNIETTTTLNPYHRKKSVTVPNAAASLGVSYTLERIKVGAGYRWERYFDVIDGGIATRSTYDRTIDGPYFKVAIGFGG